MKFIRFSIIIGFLLRINHSLKEISLSQALCNNTREPQVAYCINGLARSIRLPNVYVSLKKNLVDSFGGNQSIFINIQVDLGKSKAEMIKDLEIPLNYLGSLVKVVNVYEGYQQHEIETFINPDCKFSPPWSANNDKGYLLRTIHQHACVQRCFELIENYEKENRMKFDWIIRVRTDMVYFESIMPHCLHDEDAIENGLFDRLNIVPRKYANIRFKLLSQYQKLNGTFPFINAEGLLYGILDMHNITIREVNSFIAISRYPDSNKHTATVDPLLTFELVERRFRKEKNIRKRTIMVYKALQPELTIEECTRQVDAVIKRVTKQRSDARAQKRKAHSNTTSHKM